MRDTESAVLTSGVVASGICASCNHAPNCLYLNTARQPIWFCEIFENELPGIIMPIADIKFSPTEISRESGYIGLCVNCEKREMCTLPKPESGIWHCEEYA